METTKNAGAAASPDGQAELTPIGVVIRGMEVHPGGGALPPFTILMNGYVVYALRTTNADRSGGADESSVPDDAASDDAAQQADTASCERQTSGQARAQALNPAAGAAISPATDLMDGSNGRPEPIGEGNETVNRNGLGGDGDDDDYGEYADEDDGDFDCYNDECDCPVCRGHSGLEGGSDASNGAQEGVAGYGETTDGARAGDAAEVRERVRVGPGMQQPESGMQDGEPGTGGLSAPLAGQVEPNTRAVQPADGCSYVPHQYSPPPSYSYPGQGARRGRRGSQQTGMVPPQMELSIRRKLAELGYKDDDLIIFLVERFHKTALHKLKWLDAYKLQQMLDNGAILAARQEVRN